MKSYSQAGQDLFVLNVLNHKRNGTFLEIGSNHPITISNTFLLEREYGWKGVMVDQHDHWTGLYKEHRPLSEYIIHDAVTIDYEKALENYPRDMDYLQIDLEVNNMSTLNTLLNLNDSVLKSHRFAVITFEHDFYRGDYFRTRDLSRIILRDLGYKLLYPDVELFEDWWVHPELVNPAIIEKPLVPFITYSKIIEHVIAINPTKETSFLV